MDTRPVVLCPVDFTEASDRSLPLALRVARRYGARLVLQHDVIGVPPSNMGMVWMYQADERERIEKLEAESSARMKELLATLPQDVPVEARLTRGPRIGCILELARELPAALLIMATHGAKGEDHAFLTERVVEEAPCPVLAIRADLPGGERPEDHLFAGEELVAVVPVDFSTHSQKAMASAFDMARKIPIRLHILHVEPEKSWDDIRHMLEMPLTRHRQARLDQSDSRLKALVPEDLAERVTCEVRLGQASHEALVEVKNRRAHLVVMGAHEKDALTKWLFGATSSRILRESPCPVWFVSEKVPFELAPEKTTAVPAA